MEMLKASLNTNTSTTTNTMYFRSSSWILNQLDRPINDKKIDYLFSKCREVANENISVELQATFVDQA